MGTQKPLKDMIPEIVKHIDQFNDFSEFNLKLYRVAEGQIRDAVEDSLRRESFSVNAFNRAKERIPPINIVRKSAQKLSKVYMERPTRKTDKEPDQKIMDELSREIQVNNSMANANFIYNVHNMFALEPYIEDRKHKVRVLGGHQFLPFSDDPSNPNLMTVFIKFLGSRTERVSQKFDDKGIIVDKETTREIDLFALFSDDEFLIINRSGPEVDLMKKLNLPTKNPFGRIPFVYGNRSQFELVPFPNQAAMDISVLIPKLLTDLNYSAQFQSHTIIWSKNADLTGQSINPDAIIDLGEGDKETGDPEIGILRPEVDIENNLKLIEFQMEAYFSSIGIKANTQGTMSNGRDSSALGKAIDEGDTTSERKAQTEFFRDIEMRFWDLMVPVQKVWSRENKVDNKSNFSSEFSDQFRIHYAEMRPIKTVRQLIEEIQLKRDQRLITRRMAIKDLNPDLSEKQLNEHEAALDKEAEEDFKKMLTLGVSSQPERTAAGTFNEGNQAAANQTEMSKDISNTDERTN